MVWIIAQLSIVVHDQNFSIIFKKMYPMQLTHASAESGECIKRNTRNLINTEVNVEYKIE